jgi:hypothetical protein
VIGAALIATSFCGMHQLAGSCGLNAAPLHFSLVVASFAFAGLFCLMGETEVEDGIKCAAILFAGCLLAWVFPLPWCLLPGLGAVIGSVANWTMQATVGRWL